MDGPVSKLEFLGDSVFDFTTYDREQTEMFARKAIEVCRAISENTTFEYIKNSDDYRWFLVMCNMPFFAKRINWGTSIRGAWWDGAGTYKSCGLWSDDHQVTELVLTADEWIEFVDSVVAFADEA